MKITEDWLLYLQKSTETRACRYTKILIFYDYKSLKFTNEIYINIFVLLLDVEWFQNIILCIMILFPIRKHFPW